MEWCARPPVRRLALALIPIALGLWGLLGCHRSLTTATGPLPQRGYLWQRAWSPAVIAAVSEGGKHNVGKGIMRADILLEVSIPDNYRAKKHWPALNKAGDRH